MFDGMYEEESTDDDLRSELLQAIAEGMATLSEASDAPNDVRPAATTFNAGEVDFGSDAWMTQLIEVQGWLNFGELSHESRDDFLLTLLSELELDENSANRWGSGVEALTTAALRALQSRIDLATRLQEAFLQDLEQGTTRGNATQTWSDAWEEQVADDEPSPPRPVRAKAEVWPIQSLAHGRLNLTPSYQRGDVWNNTDRSALIESILRGIPLPSIILLRNPAPKPRDVVDGKQRLTAILRFVGTHPVAKQKVDEVAALHPEVGFRELFKRDYPAFKRAWKNKMGETLSATVEDEYYFPFKLRSGKESALNGTDLEHLKGKYYTQIRSTMITVAEEDLEIGTLFEEPADYKIPVIEYTQAERRQIHEVFKLYNKQGVHLNAEEIRNAVYHEVELTRAILFAAGDADRRRSVTEVAPALESVRDLEIISDALTGYGFGIARYKRTKVLAWIISVLTFDPGRPFASTATHTNQMLADLQDHQDRRLRSSEGLADLFEWMVQSFDIHSAHDELWSQEFMGGKSEGKWQELQLVGSVVGIALATIARPNEIRNLLVWHANEIRAASESPSWRRPKKTQTRNQWDYIGRLVRGILEILGIDGHEASRVVRARFGASGFEQLQAMISPALAD